MRRQTAGRHPAQGEDDLAAAGAPTAEAALPAALLGEAAPAPPPIPFDRLRRGSALFAVTYGGALGVSLLGSVLLVRLAAPADVASYLLLVQAVGTLSYVLQLGLAPATLRFAPLARGVGGGRASALLRRRLFALQALIWSAVLPPLLLGWPALVRALDAPELAAAGPQVAGAAAVASFGVLAAAYLRAFRRYGAAALIGQLSLRTLTAAAFLALLVLGFAPVAWTTLTMAFVAAHAATALAFAVALFRTTPLEEDEPRTAQEPPPAGPLGRMVGVMGLRSLTGLLLGSADLWVLSVTRSHQEVAVYGMMARLLQVVAVSGVVTTLVVPQELSVLAAAGRRRELQALARDSATLAALVALAAAGALLVVGRPLIAVAFGPEYVAGWGVLLILAAGALFDAACGPAGHLLQVSGHHVALLGSTVVAATLGIGLALALAPVWGGYGVATGTSLALVALNLLNLRAVRRRLGVRLFVHGSPREWRRLALAALAGVGGGGR